MTDVLCTVGMILLLIALVGLGSFIVALIDAQPADECTYCDECFDTYTGEDGKIHFVCERCAFNPENHKKKDS